MSAGLRIWHVHVAGGVACALLTVLAFVTMVLPVRRQQVELSELKTQLRGRQEAAAKLRSQRQLLVDRTTEARELLEVSEVQLEPLQNLNARLADITLLVGATGMTIHETELGGSSSEQQYQTVQIRIAGTGSYSQCADFLHRLRGSMPDIGVESFDMTGNPRDLTGTPKFRFDLVWYAAPGMTASAER
ncbi:MAG: type 4a pilus biogenesis protein PilO [Planctomycetota bacterium]|jgi:Tfp pilus assembly protein PilO